MLKQLPKLKPDPIFGLNNMFTNDIRKNKINLIVGEIVKNNNLYKFNCVKNIENCSIQSYKYLPMSGDKEFIEISKNIIFGNSNYFKGFQTLSGTGSLSMANHILKLINFNNNVITSNYFWPNHSKIFNITRIYNHYNIEELYNIMDNTIYQNFLFQVSCHNPTGIDHTIEQWNRIAYYAKKNNHLIILDNAYQGLASGCLNKDAIGIRILEKHNVNMIICSSFSKNMGLYNTRTGSLFTNLNINNLHEHLELYARTNYSNPPALGSNIVKNVYNYKSKLWKEEIKNIVNDIIDNRFKLYNTLLKYNLDWTNIIAGKGLFTTLPLNEKQIEKLKNDFGIYMLNSGRINLAAFDNDKINYFVKSIQKVI